MRFPLLLRRWPQLGGHRKLALGNPVQTWVVRGEHSLAPALPKASVPTTKPCWVNHFEVRGSGPAVGSGSLLGGNGQAGRHVLLGFRATPPLWSGDRQSHSTRAWNLDQSKAEFISHLLAV